jgi:hypothetical protein
MVAAAVFRGNNPQHPGTAQALAPQLERLRWETCETLNYKGGDFGLLGPPSNGKVANGQPGTGAVAEE